MKGSALLLICMAMLTIPGSAHALPINTNFAIFVPNGPDPDDVEDVGVLSFKLDSDLGAAGCRYGYVWKGATPGALVAACFLDEEKTHDHASCMANIQIAFDTLITKPPRFACKAIDGFGQQREFLLLVALESADPAEIIGMVQWTAASTLVSTFVAKQS